MYKSASTVLETSYSLLAAVVWSATVIKTDGTDELNQGDEIVVDLLSGRIENITTGKVYFGSRLPQHVLSIVEDGGLKNHLKKTLKKG